MPQSFVTALSYELSFGAGKRLGDNTPGLVKHILGGWQTSTIVRLNSGLPLFPVVVNTSNNPLSVYGFPGYQRPNLVGDPDTRVRVPEHWFNTDAFAEPVAYTYGNAPRHIDSLRESAERNVDLAVSKVFKKEAFRIQFRTEFLNLFNTPQFGGGDQWGSNIQNCRQCGQFGEVFDTRNNPRNIQLGLKAEFE